MKVYISGAVTGVEDYEEKFARREFELRQIGHTPINPIKIGKLLKHKLKREPTYDEYLAADLKELAQCDAINFLPDWEKSNGAQLEHKYAVENKKIILKFKLLPHKW